MASIPRPKLNKIPGGGMPLAKRENHNKDLTKLTLIELLEIKDRESRLLRNKGKLNLLPDKGKRIQEFYDKVLNELQRRANIDEAANMFSDLNIADKGQNQINQLEWNGKLNNNSDHNPDEDVLDSDDETEMDPLRLIAQRSMHERKIKNIPAEKTLITAEDMEDIKSFKTDSTQSPTSETVECVEANVIEIDVNEKLASLKPKLQQLQNAKQLTNGCSNSYKEDHLNRNREQTTTTHSGVEVDQHARYIVDLVEAEKPSKGEKFKPYQTTISHVHDPEKEKLRKKNKHWEVTAATPPPINHAGTKLLTLMDSVELQSSYLAKLKELQEKQAAERLASKIERLKSRKEKLPSEELLKSSALFTSYRNPVNNIEGEIIGDFNEVLDPLDEEKSSGFVNYRVNE